MKKIVMMTIIGLVRTTGLSVAFADTTIVDELSQIVETLPGYEVIPSDNFPFAGYLSEYDIHAKKHIKLQGNHGRRLAVSIYEIPSAPYVGVIYGLIRSNAVIQTDHLYETRGYHSMYRRNYACDEGNDMLHCIYVNKNIVIIIAVSQEQKNGFFGKAMDQVDSIEYMYTRNDLVYQVLTPLRIFLESHDEQYIQTGDPIIFDKAGLVIHDHDAVRCERVIRASHTIAKGMGISGEVHDSGYRVHKVADNSSFAMQGVVGPFLITQVNGDYIANNEISKFLVGGKVNNVTVIDYNGREETIPVLIREVHNIEPMRVCPSYVKQKDIDLEELTKLVRALEGLGNSGYGHDQIIKSLEKLKKKAALRSNGYLLHILIEATSELKNIRLRELNIQLDDLARTDDIV